MKRTDLGVNGHSDFPGHVKLVHLDKASHPNSEHGLLRLAVCQNYTDGVRQDVVDYQRGLEGHDILWKDVAGDAILRYDLRRVKNKRTKFIWYLASS